jgi:hypothetical protein
MGNNGRFFVKEHYDRRNIARVLKDRIVALAGAGSPALSLKAETDSKPELN